MKSHSAAAWMLFGILSLAVLGCEKDGTAKGTSPKEAGTKSKSEAKSGLEASATNKAASTARPTADLKTVAKPPKEAVPVPNSSAKPGTTPSSSKVAPSAAKVASPAKASLQPKALFEPKPNASPRPGHDRYGFALPPTAIDRLGPAHLSHRGKIGHIGLTSDGRTLATSGKGDFVRTFDTRTGMQTAAVKVSTQDRVLDMALTPDGSKVVVNDGCRIEVWSVASASELAAADLNSCEVESYRNDDGIHIMLSPDGRRVAVRDSTSISLYSVPELKLEKRIPAVIKTFIDMAFSPDSGLLVSLTSTWGNADGGKPILHLWDGKSGARRLPKMAVLKTKVGRVMFSDDGRHIFHAGGEEPDSTVVVDVATGQVVATEPLSERLIGGYRLRKGKTASHIKIFKATHPAQLVGEFKVGESAVERDRFALQSGLVAVADRDYYRACGVRVVRVSDRATFPIDTLRPTRGLALSADGKVAVHSAGRFASVWKVQGTRLVRWGQRDDRTLFQSYGSPINNDDYGKDPEEHSAPLVSTAVSADGRFAAVTADKLRLVDVTLGAVVGTHSGRAAVAFSADSKYLVTPTERFELVTGKRLEGGAAEGAVPPGLFSIPPKNGIFSAAVSGDGRRIVLVREIESDGADDGKRFVWLKDNTKKGATIRRWIRKSATAAALSADGQQLAVGYSYGAVVLYDISAAKPKRKLIQLRKLRGHSSPVRHIAFSADGKRLISSSDGALPLVWDLTVPAPE